jgi:osmotically-inducible protein OsmY
MERKDSVIRDDVYAELAWDPKVTIANLDVRVNHGHVTLTGVAATFATKYAAADAAYRVYGVKDVDNDILVDPAAFGLRTDSQIEADVHGMLTLDLEVPDTRILVSVLDGVVTLGGDVDYYYQRDAAEDDAASIAGVRDVISNIAVLDQSSAPDIADQIAAAFARNGELFDDNISVLTNGHSVTLSGTVRYWSEYDMAEDVAWRAPGVTNVTNNVVVTY